VTAAVWTRGKAAGPAAGTAYDECEENMTNDDKVQQALLSFSITDYRPLLAWL